VRLREEGRTARSAADLPESALRRLIDETGVVPALHQIELHPWRQQVPLGVPRRTRDRHRRVEPAGAVPCCGRDGHGARGEVRKDARADRAALARAARHGRRPARRVRRDERIREHLEITDFELADDDVVVLRARRLTQKAVKAPYRLLKR